MDARTFIAFRSSLTSRRGALAHLGGGLLGAQALLLGNVDAEARKHRQQRKRKNRRQNKRNNAKTRLDATCAGSGATGVRHPAGEVRVAQTFTTRRSGPLVKATLPITNISGGAGEFVLRLSPVDSSGLPTNEVLAEATAAGDHPLDAEVELEFAFADPFSVKAGNDYALVLTRRSADSFVWRADEGNPCAGAISFSPDQTAPFQDFNEDVDFVFATFVRS
jgi:hypothetical protein